MSRKAGTVSDETKARLLWAATEEFAANGYRRTTLRKICDTAGVTTGAVYFFFDNKEDLFHEVISPVTEFLPDVMRQHYAESRKKLEEGEISKGDDDLLRGTMEVLNFYHQNKQVCDIVLANRDDPAVEKFFDELSDIIDGQTIWLIETAGKSVDEFGMPVIHWYSHLQIDAVLYVVSQDLSESEGRAQLKVMVRLIKRGFHDLFE